jgi:hypothetical protein
MPSLDTTMSSVAPSMIDFAAPIVISPPARPSPAAITLLPRTT